MPLSDRHLQHHPPPMEWESKWQFLRGATMRRGPCWGAPLFPSICRAGKWSCCAGQEGFPVAAQCWVLGCCVPGSHPPGSGRTEGLKFSDSPVRGSCSCRSMAGRELLGPVFCRWEPGPPASPRPLLSGFPWHLRNIQRVAEEDSSLTQSPMVNQVAKSSGVSGQPQQRAVCATPPEEEGTEQVSQESWGQVLFPPSWLQLAPVQGLGI